MSCAMQRELPAACQLQRHEAMQLLVKLYPSLQREQQILQRLLACLCDFNPEQRITVQELLHNSALLSLSQL